MSNNLFLRKYKLLILFCVSISFFGLTVFGISCFVEMIEKSNSNMTVLTSELSSYEEQIRMKDQTEFKYGKIERPKQELRFLEKSDISLTIIKLSEQIGFSKFSVKSISTIDASDLKDFKRYNVKFPRCSGYKVSLEFFGILERQIFDFISQLSYNQGFILIDSLSISLEKDIDMESLRQINAGNRLSLISGTLDFYWIFVEKK